MIIVTMVVLIDGIIITLITKLLRIKLLPLRVLATAILSLKDWYKKYN